jgi:hypothetical protein
MRERDEEVPAKETATEEKYRRLIEAHRASGGAETLRQFAERMRVPHTRLWWWHSEIPRRARLRAARGEAPSASALTPIRPLSLVPVRVVPDRLPERELPASRVAGLEVVLRGERVIRVPAGFEPATLATLVSTLEGVPC